MAKTAGSSLSNEWETPPEIFNKLNEEFNFQWDLACRKENAKCKNGLFFPEHNSLEVDWHKLTKGWMWLNPPYSPLQPWIKKTQKEYELGAKIVMLIPPQSPARFFTRVLPTEIRLITGRIPFLLDGKPQKSNTRDSGLYIYGPTKNPTILFLDRNEFYKGTTG